MSSDKRDFAEYFFAALSELMQRNDCDDYGKAMLSRLLLRELVDTAIADDRQFFSSFYAKLSFFLSKNQFQNTIETSIKKCNYILNRAFSSKNNFFNRKQLNSVYFSIAQLVSDYTKIDIPDTISNSIASDSYFEADNLTKELPREIEKVEAVVLKRGHIEKNRNGEIIYSEIYCDSAVLGGFVLRLQYFWKDFYRCTYSGCLINLFKIKSLPNENGYFRTARETIIVLEPDILFDVTDIAECFQNRGYNYYFYFLKKYSSGSITANMMKGNFINYCFDMLLKDDEVDFDKAYNKAIAIKPLALFYLYDTDPKGLKAIKDEVKIHFDRLKMLVREISGKRAIEPSFISPDYGLQGRLDLLLEDSEQPLVKNVIELKSGKAPSVNLNIQTINGDNIRIGLWHNNLAQTSCYNLLLDSCYKGRLGNSQILYSTDPENPFRNAPNIHIKKQEVMDCRNWIVAHERALMLNHYKLFDMLNLDKIGIIPKYYEAPTSRFADAYITASAIEREYFQEFTSFIITESNVAKIGDSNGHSGAGFSSLWRQTTQEKLQMMTIITGLKILQSHSDFDIQHICFHSESPLFAGYFRKGDILIIYPENTQAKPYKGQLLRGYIIEITTDYLMVSLRNKSVDNDLFSLDIKWSIERDLIESSSKTLFRSIYEFIIASPEKKSILLGLSEPRFHHLKQLNIPELNTHQNQMLAKALASQDYFLFQGPPGTGKTSYILKNLVQRIYEDTDENILLLAYTNRAVDEICLALQKISMDFPYIRIGSKYCTNDSHNLLLSLIDTLPLRDVYKKLKNTRVFVTTCSSAAANPELFDLLTFDTLIIDEASQILEPQIIGFLAKTRRFIMIGDEKQLPAVVIQDPSKTITKSSNLQNLCLHNLADSLFDRILRNAIKNHWDNAYGMLIHQGRMHEEIQRFPSRVFYNGKLKTIPDNDWQLAKSDVLSSQTENSLIKMITKSRLIFLETTPDLRLKINYNEAQLVISLCEAIYEIYNKQNCEFNQSTIGVISPFRAQCSVIFRLMPANLRQFITIDTVERFQGSERNIIIVSTVVNHKHLLNNIVSEALFNGVTVDRKLNVVLTRAKDRFIMLGNSQILKELPIYSKLITHIKKYNGYFDNTTIKEHINIIE